MRSEDYEKSTLRASLSGAFLQTLPELLTPLKGHSIFAFGQLSADAARVPSERFGLMMMMWFGVKKICTMMVLMMWSFMSSDVGLTN